MRVCRQPRALYDASRLLGAGAAIPGVAIRGNWTLREERRGKPAWVSEGPGGSTIAFDLRFGAAPRAVVSWVQGYEGFGDATAGFVGNQHPEYSVLLRGTRSDAARVTQARSGLGA